MFKKDSKKGFALGAAFALLASMFAVAPAAQADEDGVVVAPLQGTSYNMLVTEEFVLTTRLGSNVDASNVSRIKYIIEKPADSYKLNMYTTNIENDAPTTANSSSVTVRNYILAAAATVSEAVTTSYAVNTVNKLVIRPVSYSGNLSDVTSVSPAVAVKVTAFLDLTPDGVMDSTEPREVVTINFVPWSSMTTTLDFTQPKTGDSYVTASATVTGVNFEQLNEKFAIYFTTTQDSLADAYDVDSKSASLSPAAVVRGELSHSEAIGGDGAAANQSFSAVVIYGEGEDVTTQTLVSETLGATARTIDGITVSTVVSANAKKTDADTGEVRTNAAFSFQAWPYTSSSFSEVAVPLTMRITSTTNVDLSNDMYMTIEGVKYTESSKLPTVSGLVLAAGKATIDITTVGFSGDEAAAFTFYAQNKTDVYDVDWNVASYTLENGDANANTKPGTALSLAWDVEDQWGQASANPNHRVVAYWVGDSNFSASATSSFAVSGAASTVTMTPSPATATGSATLRVSLQTKDIDSGLWSTNETEDVTVVVSALTGGFTSSAVASKSASISYAVADGTFSWSPAFSGTSAIGGQEVVISGTSVVFKSATGKTASGTITVRAGSDGAFTFYAASALAGSHTISMVAGGATTTSLLVVSPALHNVGKTVTIDKTEILAGATTTITGTLVDANGNPVATGDTASILVKWTGKGLPFNLPTATDADGEFEFQVLALSTEVGEAAVSVTYMPTGSTTYTKNITSVYAVDIVSSLTDGAAADQKITVGTFKGYVAIYTKGYMGQKLSAKVAGKWLVVDPIAAFKSNDYSRTVRLTGAGYTITVDLYIDGVFVRSEVVTTK